MWKETEQIDPSPPLWSFYFYRPSFFFLPLFSLTLLTFFPSSPPLLLSPFLPLGLIVTENS